MKRYTSTQRKKKQQHHQQQHRKFRIYKQARTEIDDLKKGFELEQKMNRYINNDDKI